jgi:hypothetical protein
MLSKVKETQLTNYESIKLGDNQPSQLKSPQIEPKNISLDLIIPIEIYKVLKHEVQIIEKMELNFGCSIRLATPYKSPEIYLITFKGTPQCNVSAILFLQNFMIEFQGQKN